MGCRQGIYRRSDNHVAVRPIKLTSTVTLNPGESADSIRGYQKKRLFSLRRIGIANSKWAIQMILACGDQKLMKFKPEVTDISKLTESEEVVLTPPVPPSNLGRGKGSKKSKK